MDEKRQYLPPIELRDLRPEFWRAVLAMRNHVMLHCKSDYFHDLYNGRAIDGSLWHAILVIGDQLDNAIAEKWLFDRE